MNKTAVKETARERGPHLRPRQVTSGVAVSFPLPGPQNCLNDAGAFTARGSFDPSQIISIEVDLIVSFVNDAGEHTTRLIPGNVSINATDWSCPYDPTAFPLPADSDMPAVLIVRGTTTLGATVIVNVPFCHDPTLPPPAP
jgi:hypothetical protein